MANLIYEAKYQLITRGMLVALGLGALMTLLYAVIFPSWIPAIILYILLLLGAVALTYVQRKQMTVFVYEDRVEFVSSFIRMNSRRLEASKIESVDVRDTLLGNKLYGSVTVRGSGMAKMILTPIKSQQELAEKIRTISSAPQDKEKTSNSSSTSSTGNLVSDLKQLEQLKKDGVISESEFQELKQKAIQGN